MKNLKYAAIFYPDTNGTRDSISVFFPDLPGCLTCGDDIDHAYEMAKEAMTGWLVVEASDNEGRLPEATATNIITTSLANGVYDDPDNPYFEKARAMVMLVEISPIALRESNNKAVRINTSVPGWMKDAAEQNGINISQVLQEALREKLNV